MARALFPSERVSAYYRQKHPHTSSFPFFSSPRQLYLSAPIHPWYQQNINKIKTKACGTSKKTLASVEETSNLVPLFCVHAFIYFQKCENNDRRTDGKRLTAWSQRRNKQGKKRLATTMAFLVCFFLALALASFQRLTGVYFYKKENPPDYTYAHEG
jgi:hypothetical protein